MTRLPARRFTDRPAYTVVLGPCPGCDDWQLDYTDEVAEEYQRPSWEDPNTFTIRDFRAVIEEVLAEHLAECPHLRDLIRG